MWEKVARFSRKSHGYRATRRLCVGLILVQLFTSRRVEYSYTSFHMPFKMRRLRFSNTDECVLEFLTAGTIIGIRVLFCFDFYKF